MSAFVTAQEFASSMEKLGVNDLCPKIAVAVSGGGDSMALVALMQDWVKARGGELLALTVDHQLRAGSSAEAQKTAQLLKQKGIAHEVLVWQGDKPSTHVQEKARTARYALLLEACRHHGLKTLAVAHNLEDQAETFWMRLAHGSGLDGLAGMAPVRKEGDSTIIRPLLSFPRARLRATCLYHGLEWIEDPSNENAKYLRARLRGFEEALAMEGLSPSRLMQTLQKLEDARQALQAVTEKELARCLELHAEGYATLRLSAWRECPVDIQRRLLVRALVAVAPQTYPPGADLMEQTRLDLHGDDFAGKTLAGCEVFPGKDGDVLIIREAAAMEGRKPATAKVWDNRFMLSGFPDKFTEVGPLGEKGVSELRKNQTSNDPVLNKLESLHFKVRRVLPALWKQENLIAVPGLGYYSQEWPSGAQIKAGYVEKSERRQAG